jgi:hypothetical protein
MAGMSAKQRKHKLGLFQGLADYLGQANLDVSTAAAILGGKPKQRSIERLMAGHPIRLSSAYRLGHLINKHLARSRQGILRLADVIVAV